MPGSLAAEYEKYCKEASVKVNSKVVADLKELPDTITKWNLKDTMIGSKGARICLTLIKNHMPDLEVLDLSGNNLNSAFTKELLESVVSHPKLHTINLSDNDIRLGGPELIELVKRNRRIIEIDIANTHLRNLFVRLLEIQLRKNAEKAGVKREDKRMPSESPFSSNPDGADDQPFSKDDNCGWGNYNGKHRFSFGDPSPENDDAQREEDDAAFAHFRKVAFENPTAAGEENGTKKQFVPRRPTVCAEVYKEEEIDNFEAPQYPKEDKDAVWLLSVLERHDLFSHLEDFELSVAVAAMEEVKRGKGDTLFDIGDEGNDMFYVVADGEVTLTDKDGEVTKTLKRGQTMNDLVLLYPNPPVECATCSEPSTVFTLERQTYKIILSRASKKKRAMYEGFLSTVNFLKEARLSKGEMLQLADSLKPANYEPGATLIEYGEVGESFFIIVEGTVEVFGRNDNNEVIKVCEFTVGDCVGELEFLRSHRCVADVKAKDFVRTAKMNRLHFEMVMGPVKEVLARTAGESNVYSYYRQQLEKMERTGHTPEPTH